MGIRTALLAGFSAALFTVAAPAQTRFACPQPGTEACQAVPRSFGPSVSNIDTSAPDARPQETPTPGTSTADIPASSSSFKQEDSFLTRTFKRGLEDQKGLYTAPFKASNLKWDVPFLAGTGAFLATDRRIEAHLPDGHFQLYQNSSNIALGGIAASAAGIWAYGIKTENPHAKETGELALETVANTFLIYAPMQLIAGRQRPGEGNGKGDFLQHHSLNTSFPGGHAMFTWGLASVIAHEYPKPWVKTLAYGAALSLTASRFLARDHWSSDMFVGSALGFAIGTNIFHSRCDPELSPSCHHHTRRKDLP